MSGTVYDDSDPLPGVTYDLVPTGEHEAALAEVERLREEHAQQYENIATLQAEVERLTSERDVALDAVRTACRMLGRSNALLSDVRSTLTHMVRPGHPWVPLYERICDHLDSEA